MLSDAGTFPMVDTLRREAGGKELPRGIGVLRMQGQEMGSEAPGGGRRRV